VKSENLPTADESKANVIETVLTEKTERSTSLDSVVKEEHFAEGEVEDGALNLVKVKKCDVDNVDVQKNADDDRLEHEHDAIELKVVESKNDAGKEDDESKLNDAGKEDDESKLNNAGKEDDDETLSESDVAKDLDSKKFTSELKQASPRTPKNEVDGLSLTKDEIDDDLMDRSAVTSPCPEVGIIVVFFNIIVECSECFTV